MAAALVASLVELVRLQPAFAASGESADQALARVRPMLAILVDALSDVAESDLFLARARSRSVAVALFCGLADKPRHTEWALQRDVPVFGLPADSASLQSWLTELAGSPISARARGERRTAPSASRQIDGTLVLLDARGMRWSVYDRRSADRRRGIVTERHFVNDSGEERSCELRADEALDMSPTALNDQLARSIAVP
jgi:hypothetical protein